MDAGGLFVVGSLFGAAGGPSNQLLDNGANGDAVAGDGVYTIRVMVPADAHFYYALANGNCPNYSCKENLAELDCGQGAYGDRYMDNTGSSPFAISTTFGVCPTGTQGGNDSTASDGAANGIDAASSSGGSDTGMIIGIAVAAIVVVLAALLVLKNKLAVEGGPSGGVATPGFDNPLYDSTAITVHANETNTDESAYGVRNVSNPTFDGDDETGGANSASGYMDVPANHNGTDGDGYLEVNTN